jgi:hypothetical protein
VLRSRPRRLPHRDRGAALDVGHRPPILDPARDNPGVSTAGVKPDMAGALEREQELERIAQALDDALRGSGSVLGWPWCTTRTGRTWVRLGFWHSLRRG